MANTDTMVSLDPEDSAQILEMVEDFSLEMGSPRVAGAVFGSARKRSLSKAKEPSRRDSQTLPWKSPMRNSNARKENGGAKDPSASSQPARSESPDIDTILAKTPRPRRVSSTGLFTSPRSQNSTSSRTSPTAGQKDLSERSLTSIYSSLPEDDSEVEGGGSESDSSIDIHTPLPHLMFRDGLLSPRSKLLPQSTSTQSIYSAFADDSPFSPSRSVLSLASTAGSVVTKSGLQKDPRDTERRRVRHRDGKLLKAGMGLTTGLGWSDSEDEDAPSTLTRRLIATTIERKRATSTSSRPTSVYDSSGSRLTSPVPSTSSRILSPKSTSNLRSASISFPAKSPTSPASGPGMGLRIPRGRAASAAASGSARFKASKSPLLSPPLLASSPELDEALSSITEATLLRAGFTSPTPNEPESTNASSVSLLTQSTGRSRAESNASTTSMVTTTSFSSVSPSRIIPKPAPAVSSASKSSNITSPALRERAESTSSNITNGTAASSSSSYSQNSSSTSVPSSSSGSVPRPLRLPQAHAAGIKPARSFSQDHASASSVSVAIGGATVYQRSRTFSSPQSTLRTPSTFAQGRTHTTSNSLSSGVLPPGAPPTLRQRPAPPGGARPRPRTGTGMVYRTSSYTSFHEGGNRMRGSVASP